MWNKLFTFLLVITLVSCRESVKGSSQVEKEISYLESLKFNQKIDLNFFEVHKVLLDELDYSSSSYIITILPREMNINYLIELDDSMRVINVRVARF